MRNVSLLFAVLLLFATGALLGLQLEWFLSRDDTEQLRKLEEAFLLLNKRYVEEVDPDGMAEDGIRAMLGELDPHSSYVDAETFTELRESYRGSFGGIGIWFDVPQGDTARVVALIEGGPSEKTAMRAGDRIIAVNDTSVVGMDNQDLRSRLKGPIGTSVAVTLKRLGMPQPIEVHITRGKISLVSVTSAYMVDDRTGYIKISRFSQTTATEFRRSVALLRDSGMDRLLLDLRTNPGGVLSAAVGVVDELLSDDRLIVYTHGRSVPSQRFYSEREGLFEEQPVIVLLNHNSISASEVVAGALQDQDRALLVGQTSYGKGLVQNHFLLPDKSRLEMVTARYHTPSGRIIQTPYDTGDRGDYMEQKVEAFQEIAQDIDAYLEGIPDSLRYQTMSGRTVYGGGGILPDVVIPPDTSLTPLMRAIYSGVFYEPFYRWFTREEQVLRARWNGQLAPFKESFTMPESTWAAFVTLTEDEAAASALDRVFTAEDIAAHRSTLELHLKALLARQLFGGQAANSLYNKIDPVFLQALALWEEAEALPGIMR